MHNYLKKIARLTQEGKIPTSRGLNDLTIAHDNWCHIYRGGDCNCDPDVELRRGVSVDEVLERSAKSTADFEARVRNLLS